MVELLGLQRDPGHEGEGRGEIREAQDATDRVALRHLSPRRQSGKRLRARRACKLFRHMASPIAGAALASRTLP